MVGPTENTGEVQFLQQIVACLLHLSTEQYEQGTVWSGDFDSHSDLTLQPKPSTNEQGKIVNDILRTYAGLVQLGRKLRDTDAAYAAEVDISLNPEWHEKLQQYKQYEVLWQFQKKLRHKANNFLLFAPIGTAAPMEYGRAIESDVLAQLWKHSIDVILEHLRQHHPWSQNHWRTVVRMTHQTMEQLLGTLPELRCSLIECLHNRVRPLVSIEEEENMQASCDGGAELAYSTFWKTHVAVEHESRHDSPVIKENGQS